MAGTREHQSRMPWRARISAQLKISLTAELAPARPVERAVSTFVLRAKRVVARSDLAMHR